MPDSWRIANTIRNDSLPPTHGQEPLTTIESATSVTSATALHPFVLRADRAWLGPFALIFFVKLINVQMFSRRACWLGIALFKCLSYRNFSIFSSCFRFFSPSHTHTPSPIKCTVFFLHESTKIPRQRLAWRIIFCAKILTEVQRNPYTSRNMFTHVRCGSTPLLSILSIWLHMHLDLYCKQFYLLVDVRSRSRVRRVVIVRDKLWAFPGRERVARDFAAGSSG